MNDCYECPCGYVYDPADNGDKPFEDLPNSWRCPKCGAYKDEFDRV